MNKVVELKMCGHTYTVHQVPWEQAEGDKQFVLSHNDGMRSEPMARDGVLEYITLRVHSDLEQALRQAG